MDPVDYVNWGFIGCNPQKNVSWENLVYDYGYEAQSSWEYAYITFNAAFDAFRRSLGELIEGHLSMYVYIVDTDRYIVSNIDTAGQQRFIQSMNNIFSKELIFVKNAKIFWNTFPIVDKKNDTQEFQYTKLYADFNNSTDYVTETYTIDFSLYPKMTKEIYDNYFNSLSDYIFSIKCFLKASSNSDFEKFIIPG